MMLKEKIALSIDDIRAMEIGPNLSIFDTLKEVLAVVTKKLKRAREVEYEKDGRNIDLKVLEKFDKNIRLMREKILKQPSVEDEYQVKSFAKNHPQRNCYFKRKQSLEEEEEEEEEEETMELKKKRNMPISKKGKRFFESESEEVAVRLKRKKKNDIVPTGQEPQPGLPEEFKNLITEDGGSDVMLVIQKKLYAADIKSDQSRLSIPVSQIKNDFLTDTEKAMLNSRKEKDEKHWNEIEVPLIDPSLNRQIVYLRKWNMKKNSGSYTSMYVLTKSWNEIVWSNKLKENNVVQLWSFRVGTELCFALVKVERGREDCGSSSKSSGMSASSSTIKEGENGAIISSICCESIEESSSGIQRSEEGASSSSPEKEIEDGGMQCNEEE